MTEASSSPPIPSARSVGERSGSFASHVSPHGSASYESQLVFDYSPPPGQSFRAEAPAQRFSGHGSHGDGSAPIGFVLNAGPPPESQPRSSFASSPGYLNSVRDGLSPDSGQWHGAEVQPQLQISYLLGDSPSTQAGSGQLASERAESLISDADPRSQPADPDHCGFTGRQAFLFRTYIMRIAPSVSFNLMG